MKKIINFYINSSIHVALAVVSLTLVTALHFEVSMDVFVLLFIFFGAVTSYNFVKYAGVAGLHHRSLAPGLRNIQIFSIFSFTGLLITAFLISTEILIWSALFGILTLLYALPVFGERRNLRSIFGIKIFIIALVWAGVTVVLPVADAGNVIFTDLLLEFVQRFLLVLVWILPFEIRDLKYDLEQLGTIPQRIGITPTKVLGLVLLSMVVLLEPFKSSALTAAGAALAIVCIISGIFVIASRENQARYFAAFWVESIPIFWLFILLVLRSL